MDTSKFSNFTIDHILRETVQRPTAVGKICPAPKPREGPPFYFHKNGYFWHADFMPVVPGQQMGLYACLTDLSRLTCCGSIGYQANVNKYYFPCQQSVSDESGWQTGQSRISQTSEPRQRSRVRTVFTESQKKRLDRLFALTDYPSVEARAELAKSTGLSEEAVRVWFKNRRARRKRQKATKSKSAGSYPRGMRSQYLMETCSKDFLTSKTTP
ncbi:dharma [Chanos chanos]|uniref:Dharma n=1 Tax=Chanos chanos TaxID=29144 RepID=A0A6J2VPQ6_CHACN|nr:homeobox expressed in ES cells 1-like [Chanos chanos]